MENTSWVLETVSSELNTPWTILGHLMGIRAVRVLTMLYDRKICGGEKKQEGVSFSFANASTLQGYRRTHLENLTVDGGSGVRQARIS